MNRAHIIILVVFALLFLITGVWQNKTAIFGEEVKNEMEDSVDKSSVRDFWSNYNRASEFMNHSVYDSAAVYYEKALRLNEKHEGSLYSLGNAKLFLKEFEEAETYWQKLVQLNPTSARGWLQLGTLYFCLDDKNSFFDLNSAEEHFREALSLYREETGPPLHLSKIALLKGEPGEAEEWVDIVLASNFMSYQALFLKGYIEWGTGNIQSGRKRLSEAIDLYESITGITMAGEGETAAGFRPMLSDDMYCDFLGNRIEQIIINNIEFDSGQIYEQFYSDITEWNHQLNLGE